MIVPHRLGASRPVLSRTDCLVERRVHRLVVVFVLQAKASRPAAPSHVRVLAWGLPPAITLSQFLSERRVRREGKTGDLGLQVFLGGAVADSGGGWVVFLRSCAGFERAIREGIEQSSPRPVRGCFA